jgi:predicted Zn-dependent peptidase
LLGAALFTGCASLGHSNKVWKPEYKVRRDILSNGLTVLYLEDHSAPIVSYTTWFKVGSAWEKPGSTGIAHLFEHMMFKGTVRYPGKSFFKTLESKGAMLNAFTQRDATVYYEVAASKNLELVMDMESDRLRNLVISQADLDSERQVVKEERRLRVDSNFGAQQMEVLEKLAFPHHPYGWPVIGYQEDLDRLSLEQCRDFFKTYYQPGNAIVTIAGDFNYDQAKAWMERYYGAIPGHEVPKLVLVDDKPPGREVREAITRPVESESLLIGYHIPNLYHRDTDRLSMLSWSLFDMASSRVNKRLVREKQIALGVNADVDSGRFPGMFLISVEMKRGIGAEKALEEIDEIFAEVRRQQVSKEELDRVKNGLIYATVNETKSPSGIANWLTNGEFYWGDSGRIFEKLDRFHEMSAGDIQEVALKYLDPRNRVVVVMKPDVPKIQTKIQRAVQR